jgi:thioesterase domain-containing protein
MLNLADNCLVPLQVRGCGRPLFCLHAVGGTVAHYAPLAHRLGGLRDVYGLKGRTLGVGSLADGSIEEMASRYVTAIETAQPRGPYELIGYCMGGLIALEMTRMLRARGSEVVLTGLLDTGAPQEPRQALTSAEALALLARAIDLSIPFTADPGAPRDRLLHDFREQAVAQGRLPSGICVEDVASLADIYMINGQAIARYAPKPVPGDVSVLFSARPGLSPTTLADSWRKYIEGELRVETVDTDHFALMHERNVEQVCSVIKRWLPGETN